MTTFETAGVRIHVDDETLRESVEDPVALAAWCREHPEDPRTVAHLRMLGRLDEAAALGRRSLHGDLPPLVRAVRRTRYAHVLQWQGAFIPAEELLDLAAEETGLADPTSPSSLSVLATVFQHRAKCRFDHAAHLTRSHRPLAAGRLRESALEDARRSLWMRETLESEGSALIASSRQTLARIERPD